MINVIWDTTTDEYPKGDPKMTKEEIIGVPLDIYESDKENNFEQGYVTEWLSDSYSWCVLDWSTH